VDSATLRTLLTAGRYQATTDMECLAARDAIIICVPTPLRKSKDPDVSFVLPVPTPTVAELAKLYENTLSQCQHRLGQ
jgi:UDP-N-acetyl-D-mannosaminuronate dehydrogenase